MRVKKRQGPRRVRFFPRSHGKVKTQGNWVTVSCPPSLRCGKEEGGKNGKGEETAVGGGEKEKELRSGTRRFRGQEGMEIRGRIRKSECRL